MTTAEGAGAQANGHDPWAPNEEDVEFPSGRVYTVRRSLPLQWFIMRSMAEGDLQLAEAITGIGMGTGVPVDAPEDATPEQLAEATVNQTALMGRVMQVVVEAFFVHPRVYADPESLPPDHAEKDDRGRQLAMTPLDFAEGDLEFAMERAFRGMSGPAGFRGESEPDNAGAEGGDGGEGVGSETVEPDGDDPWDHELVPG